MTSVAIVGIIAAAAFGAWHSWLVFKGGGFSMQNDLWQRCPCGHEASWHQARSARGVVHGCQSKDAEYSRSDPYGYCTCPMTREEMADAKEPVA